jgi:hypothetical protein
VISQFISTELKSFGFFLLLSVSFFASNNRFSTHIETTFDLTDNFSKMGALHSAGTTHCNAIVAVCSFTTYPGTNGLSRSLPEKKIPVMQSTTPRVNLWSDPLPIFDNHSKWLTTPNCAWIYVRYTIRMGCCLIRERRSRGRISALPILCRISFLSIFLQSRSAGLMRCRNCSSRARKRLCVTS